MIVSVDHNNISCESIDEFEKVIKQQLSLDSSEIWVSENGDTEEYPCMGILVNSTGVSLNHFGEDESCYASCSGDYNGEFVTFCDGQYEVHACQVISKEDALKALLDFYKDKGRSDSIKWDQLY